MPLYTSMLLAASVLWGWQVPGYLYLIAFGLMGAGELGGAYPGFLKDKKKQSALCDIKSLLSDT